MADFVDITSLRAFTVVAHELNMRRAADLLNISQPPLSRKIKNLEDRLGVCLFIRRSNGLELTDAGKELLGIVQPLLTMQEDVQKRLDKFKKGETCIVGLTTAFEQSVYEPVIAVLKSLCDKGKIIIKRATSVQLANDIVKGNIQVAWVALPINNSSISTINVSYSEQLCASSSAKLRSRHPGKDAEMGGVREWALKVLVGGRPHFRLPLSHCQF